MWTETTRVQYDRKAARYATDLTDGEWTVLEPLLPEQKNRHGRPRHVRLREVVNALLYLLRSGCPWRFLPRDFPAFTTVQHYFYGWRRCGLYNPTSLLGLYNCYQFTKEPAADKNQLLETVKKFLDLRNDM